MIPSTFIGYNTQKKNKIYTYNSIDGRFRDLFGRLDCFSFFWWGFWPAIINHDQSFWMLFFLCVCVLEEINGTFFLQSLTRKQRRLHGPGNFLQTPFIAASIFLFFFRECVCVCVYTLVASNKERTKIRPSHMHGKSYSSSAKGISMQLHIFSIHNITERIRKKKHEQTT
jgi:hypothetical protein